MAFSFLLILVNPPTDFTPLPPTNFLPFPDSTDFTTTIPFPHWFHPRLPTDLTILPPLIQLPSRENSRYY